MYGRFCSNILYLVAHSVIVGDLLDIPDYTEGDGEIRIFHVREHHMDASILAMGVVHEDIVFGKPALSQGHDPEAPSVEDQSLVVQVVSDENK